MGWVGRGGEGQKEKMNIRIRKALLEVGEWLEYVSTGHGQSHPHCQRKVVFSVGVALDGFLCKSTQSHANCKRTLTGLGGCYLLVSLVQICYGCLNGRHLCCRGGFFCNNKVALA